MKILITGTAGFIGFHLAEKLLSKGHSVVGIDQMNDYYDINLKYDRLKYSGIDVDKELEAGLILQSLRTINFINAHLKIKNLYILFLKSRDQMRFVI